MEMSPTFYQALEAEVKVKVTMSRSCPQALEAEVLFREQQVRGLHTRALTMLKAGHFAAPQIEAAVAELQDRQGQLKDAASLRKLRLQDALEAQMVSRITGNSRVSLG